jgi:hypothetical protein
MPVTGTNLIDGARDLADMVSDPHVSDATLLRWANRALEKLWRKLLPLHAGFYADSADFTLAGGVAGNTSALPAAARAVLGVTKDPTSTQRQKLNRRNFDERDEQYQLTFDVVGQNVVVERAEYASGAYRLFYVKGPTALAVVGDAIDAQLEPYVEYIETYMAAKALAKEESDTTDIRKDLEELWDEIEAVVMNRNMAAGETIVDVERTGGPPYLVRP